MTDLLQEQKKALTNYTKTFNLIQAFKEKHKAIFEEGSELDNKLNEQQMLIKKLASETKEEVENKNFKVVISRAFRKWFNFDEMKPHLDDHQSRQVLQECVGEVRIDTPDGKKRLNEMVEEKIIPVEAIQLSFHEEELSPRISIKPL